MNSKRLLLSLLPESNLLMPVLKGSGILLLSGAVLSLAGLNAPWDITLPIQVGIAALFTGTLAFVAGKNSKNDLSKPHQQRLYLKKLTIREREIAEFLKTTLSNKEICTQLNIELNTLKTHIRNIYRKTECSSREEFIDKFS